MSAAAGHRLAVLFAALLPFVGVVAPKGVVILLVVLGLTGVVRWIREGFSKPPVDRRIAFALLALALWATATVTWAYSPAGALALVFKLTGLSAAGFATLSVIARLDADQRRTVENALVTGMGLGIMVLAVGYVYATATSEALWSTFRSDPLTTLNTGAVTISLLGWPAIALLRRRGRARIAIAVAAAGYLGFIFLSSGAALAAPVTGLAAFVLVWLWGRRGALALAAVAAIAALAAPQVIAGLVSVEQVEAMVAEAPGSTGHRVRMWTFAVEKIDEKPIQGWGMDASRAIPGGHRELAPGTEILPLHPHNAFLQVRLELGLPGAAIVAVLLGVLFAWVVGGMDDRFGRSVAAGAGVAYLTVASISYGIWQNWWVAFAWSLAALTILAVGPQAQAGGRKATSGP